MVFFNDPIPCEHPERRAVTLGLAMRDRTERLAEEWRRRGHELRLGVGIATGFATCGQIGFDLGRRAPCRLVAVEIVDAAEHHHV